MKTVLAYSRAVMADKRVRLALAVLLLATALGVRALIGSGDPAVVAGLTDVPVPVLLYHELTPERVSPKCMIIPVHEFKEQMTLLKERGYNAITSMELDAHLRGKGALPDRPVLITFDDGYQSVYTLAYPILEELGLRATAFVVGVTLCTPNHMTYEQLREMAESGVFEIACHTYAGHGAEAPEIATWGKEDVLSDLSKLSALLQAERVPMASAFAYPFGKVTPDLEEALAELGYAVAFTTEEGLATRDDPPLRQKRITVWSGGDSAMFLQKLQPSFWVNGG